MKPAFKIKIAAVLWVTSLLLAGQTAMAQNPGISETDLFTKGYPRAFFFRTSEGLTSVGYDDWNKTFSRLGGIMGKCLDEEIPGRSSNIPFFSRFKQEHPEQLVLLHYNGNGRDPRDGSDNFYAGHWLYYEGTKPMENIPAASGVTEIKVEDPSIFKTGIGRYKNSNEDIGICRLTPDGKPDWNYAEQVQLLSVNQEMGTIKVQRGQFGTSPKLFEAGQALLCPHVTEGPWGENNNLLWLYNHSTGCPINKEGKTCDDILAEEFGRRFSDQGELKLFDGVEFDVLWNEVSHPSFGRTVDVDCDGVGDNGIIDGVNVYSVGVFNFCKKIRAAIGDDKLIMADGMTAQFQRGIGYLNGIESEGWPVHRDPEVKDWSGGWNRHMFWNQNAFEPAFSYVNFKYLQNLKELPPVSRQRLIWATAQLMDARFTHGGYRVQKPDNGIYVEIIDELVAGTRHEKYWLGNPLEPAVRTALQQPDVLKGIAAEVTSGFIKKCSGEHVSFRKESNALRVSKSTEGDMKFTISGIPCDGPDLIVSMKIKCDPRKGYPEEMPRLLQVSMEGKNKLMSYVNGEWFHATFYFRDVNVKMTNLEFEVESNENLWIKDLTVHAYPDVVYRRFENGIVIANPAHHEVEFDLKKVAEGVQYFHLRGTQDPETNNGKRAEDKMMLGERSGLFLEIKK